MAYSSELQLNGNTYEIRSVGVFVRKETDDKGKPGSKCLWHIFFIINALKDTTITEWMIDPTKKMDGKIIIHQDDNNKEIEFKESYCLSMTDEFNPGIDFASCECYIQGKEVSVNSITFGSD